MLTAIFSGSGHCAGGPNGDCVQSWARMRAPISPPPERNSGDRLSLSSRITALPLICFGRNRRGGKRRQVGRRSKSPCVCFDNTQFGSTEEDSFLSTMMLPQEIPCACCVHLANNRQALLLEVEGLLQETERSL